MAGFNKDSEKYDYLVESSIMKKTDRNFDELKRLCHLGKNLKNSNIYKIRQYYFMIRDFKKELKAMGVKEEQYKELSGYLNFLDINEKFKSDNQQDYRALNVHVSKAILQKTDSEFKTFFTNLKKFKNGKLKDKPGLPNYLPKDGYTTIKYPKEAITKSPIKGHVRLSYERGNKTVTLIRTNIKYENIRYIEIIPMGDHLKVNVAYRQLKKELKYNDRVAAIDVGVNNLITLVSNVTIPYIINGKPVKSINQYYNKKRAHLQSLLPEGIYTSKKIKKLTFKRNNKINDYMHKASRKVVNYLVDNQITRLYIGLNKDWKQSINLGKRNNQNFVMIPISSLVEKIKYKCNLEGIEVIVSEESYTSKASFINQDFIPVYKEDDKTIYKFTGYRKTRGMYKNFNCDKKYELINADVNGALNILKKCLDLDWNDTYYKQCLGQIEKRDIIKLKVA